MKQSLPKNNFVVTRNACKLCAPLGASVVFCGIKGAIALLHGSQGCATYIRRYMISHFREPVDIASSSFSEETAIFGGKDNLKAGLLNVYQQYKPQLIGIATTCLAETIGDDVGLFLRELKAEEVLPEGVRLVNVSTPSYKGTHMEGFFSTVKAVVEGLCRRRVNKHGGVNIFPSFLSCADLRYLKEILGDWGIKGTLLPDYSDTLDGVAWGEYHNIPEGGTTVGEIESMPGASASIEFSSILKPEDTSGRVLFDRFAVPCFNISIPIGIRQTDIFFNLLEKISVSPVPEKYNEERGRLVDSYADGHKYVFGKKAAIFGEEDMVISLASFLSEIGIEPVLCVSGGSSGKLKEALAASLGDTCAKTVVKGDSDFMDMEDDLDSLKPDFLIGNSKGYAASRRFNIPLVRVFFPIHDRIGGQRLLHIGYRGAQRLFDDIVNTLLSKKQDDSETGYTYL
jgi:nitrogenase molybdenum-iron protein NifN